ncbi:LexA family protein [Flavobacterium sp. 3HN19-14]|uniref:LexA family protein n=1 Tax=Flavobacterium sp. 3HN19-14 TaxID=3448133 RepID=UPI003EE34DC6
MEFFQASTENKLELPLANAGISAGFPSPAMDFMESKIDANDLLVKHPLTTFYARVSGNSMINAGIGNNDLLVIDRTLVPEDNNIAICFIDGDFTVKRLKIKKDGIYLMPENEQYEPIKITDDNQFTIWGIVTFVVKKLR